MTTVELSELHIRFSILIHNVHTEFTVHISHAITVYLFRELPWFQYSVSL